MPLNAAEQARVEAAKQRFLQTAQLRELYRLLAARSAQTNWREGLGLTAAA